VGPIAFWAATKTSSSTAATALMTYLFSLLREMRFRQAAASLGDSCKLRMNCAKTIMMCNGQLD
jgi:hypothetical protein